jgi:hypothetical protein
MPPGRSQAICLTPNAYSFERLLHRILISRLSYTTSRSFSSSLRTANNESPIRNLSKEEKDRANLEGLNVLKEALTKLRLKNRGIDSSILRKVSPPSPELHPVRVVRKNGAKNITDHALPSNESQKGREAESSNANSHQTPIFKSFYAESAQNPVERPVKKSFKKSSFFVTPFHRFYASSKVFRFLKGPASKSVALKDRQRFLDYKGFYAEPKIELPTQTSVQWLQSTGLTGSASLDQEIKDFAKFILPTEVERKAKREVSRQVQHIISVVSNRYYDSEVFGSQNADYSLSYADIDIRIFPPKYKDFVAALPSDEKLLINPFLRILAKVFEENGFIEAGVLHSRLPLLDMKHKESGLSVQIVASNCTAPSANYIIKNMEHQPDLLPVYSVIRTMLKIRGLTDVFHGGLGSYSLIIMLIASMKLSPGSGPAEILANFLEFYGKLNTKDETIGLVPPMLHPKYLSAPPLPREPSQLDQVSLQFPNNAFVPPPQRKRD